MKAEPNGWGKDQLTDFFDAADANMRATFTNKKLWTNKLIGINDIFYHALKKFKDEKIILSRFLMVRSHSAYLAACHLGFAAQCADSYPVSRSCLENALTGHFLAVNPELAKLWFSRHKGPDELKRCRKQFSYERLKKCLEAVDADLARVTDLLYQVTIDMGAHPNERSITANLKIFKDGDEDVFRMNYLHLGGLVVDVSLKTIASVGIAALRIFERVLPEDFSKHGLSERIRTLSVGL